jgi:drug/metabolite transporter (DMT)-like permease
MSKLPSSHVQPGESAHLRAALQALLVTFLWSTSWVLIKIGLKDIPALTFAGLRYTLAWLCLLPLAARSGQWAAVRRLTRPDWVRLVALGLTFYAVNQGAQFLALERLPAVTTSLLLSFTPTFVALLGIVLLAEMLTRAQWGGIALYLCGALLYFYPVAIPAGQTLGVIIALVGVGANALAAILGRDVNRAATLPALTVTTITMGIGAPVMLIAGIAAQGLPALSLQSAAIIGWLAVVNTAFAFTLWNHTQRTLPAIESSIINNTMLIQIAVLAWIFLGEALEWREIGGLALAGAGTLIVQTRRAKR